VGKFAVGAIIEDNPKALWENYRDLSGIDESDFFSYFDGMERGFAIGIKDVQMFKPIEPKKLFPNFRPPQSYCYLNTRIETVSKVIVS
jgi:type I restriction enzyme S subunit